MYCSVQTPQFFTLGGLGLPLPLPLSQVITVKDPKMVPNGPQLLVLLMPLCNSLPLCVT